MSTRHGAVIALALFVCTLCMPHEAAAQGCTISWVGASGGFWQSRFNWSPSRLPQSSDNVCIGAADVTLSDSVNAYTVNHLTTAGSFTVSGSGVFLRVQTGGTIAGSLTVQNGEMTVNGPLSVTGSVTIRNGFLTGPGPTDIGGGMVLDGLVDLAGQTINHQGVATMTSSARLRMWGGAIFNNLAGATFKAGDGIGFDAVGDSRATFNNHGTFDKTAVSFLTIPTIFGGVQFNNTGTLSVGRGILRFTAGFDQTAGATLLNATTIDTTTQPLVIRGGTLSGSGTITGNLTLAGTGVAAPGGSGLPGLITVSGNYAQTESSTLSIEIGGQSPALFDRLIVNGSATLGGILAVGVVNGFRPTTGATFPVMTFASHAGTFALVSATGFVAQVNDSNVTMVAGTMPPTLTCTPGTYPVVLEPYALEQVKYEIKPWRVSYGQLPLAFAVTEHPSFCQADSGVGELPVLLKNLLTGNDTHIADSVASATLRIYDPDTVTPPPPCDFAGAVRNNCLLNAGGGGAYYANWTTDGFRTRIHLFDPIGTVDCPSVFDAICATGPRSFWVNLNALGLIPESGASIGSVLPAAETYVHQTLIQNLSDIHRAAVVQDPGNVNLLVIDRQGHTTGRLRDGRTTNDVPWTIYIPSDVSPAVVLFARPSVEPFQVQIYGRQTGDFDLAVTSMHAAPGLPAGAFSGMIAAGQTLAFAVSVDPESGQQTASSTTVVEGDLTGDGLVTCADLAVVRAAFGTRTGQPGFNAWADKVFPGVIDVRDLAYVAQRLPAGTVCQ